MVRLIWFLLCVSLALGVWIFIVESQPTGRVNHALFEELDTEDVSSLEFIEQGTTTKIKKNPGGAFSFEEPAGARVDGRALRGLLNSLEILSYRRVVVGNQGRERFGKTRGTLTITQASGPRYQLEIGQEQTDVRGTWVHLTGDDMFFFVDTSAVEVLLKSRETLVDRRVFGEDILEKWSAIVDGQVWIKDGRTQFSEPGGDTLSFPASDSSKKKLAAIVSSLEMFGKPGANANKDFVLDLRVMSSERYLKIGGNCVSDSGSTWFETQMGEGCVPNTEITPLLALFKTREDWVERRLFVDKPSTLKITKSNTNAFTVTDRERVRVWLNETQQRVTWLPQKIPGSKISETLVVTDEKSRAATFVETKNGTFFLAQNDSNWGFPVQRKVIDEAEEWRFESLEISSAGVFDIQRIKRLSAKEQDVKRDEILEKWLVKTPVGESANNHRLNKLATEIARLRALRIVAAKPKPQYQIGKAEIEVVFSPELSGAQSEPLRLHLGAKTKDGCYLQIHGRDSVFEIGESACELMQVSWLE